MTGAQPSFASVSVWHVRPRGVGWPLASQATRIAVGMSMTDALVIAPPSEGADFSADGRFLAVTLADEVRILETTGYVR
jgi:hypothetical protein